MLSFANNIFIPVEYTVLCKVTELQQALYKALLSDTDEENLSEEQKDDALSCITTLKKLCNHPTLVYEMCKVSEQ